MRLAKSVHHPNSNLIRYTLLTDIFLIRLAFASVLLHLLYNLQLSCFQEKDIASATEKLAACQETIHLLSQQLQSLQPQSNHNLKSQSPEKKLQQHKTSELTPNSGLDDLPHTNIIQPSRSVRHTLNPTVHAIIKSSSVSSSSKEDNEKHTRGLGRFFSSKPKNSGR